jgi:hypothetical protein
MGYLAPAFLGMLLGIGEAPFIQFVASHDSTDAQLREWLRLPATRAAITEALSDFFDERLDA